MPRMFRLLRTALLPILVLAALAAPARAQEVKYEKYKLENGMTVILHEDHSVPLATINTWYRVGSKDEPVHRSGFAHLFEHLMFMGTRRVPNGQFDSIMEAGGGANNASTSEDRTNYFSSGPARLLPTLLWLDADRLEDLGRTMDQSKLDKQRDVVRNERRQSYENQPYGKASLQVNGIMYPPGHPYHIPVIGTHEDLEAAGVTDVKDFFATYYVPNNASLVVAGDFDPATIKPLIAQLFGSIPRGSEPAHHTATPAKLDHVIRATAMDTVQLPKVSFVYLSPPMFADGDAEMDLAAAVLSQGKTSRLYKRLVYDDKIASEVSAYQASNMLQSLFYIDVITNPDADLDKVERTVDEEVARLLKDGIKPDELEQRKATVELGKLAALQTASAKADQLNQYEYYWGEPNSFKRDLDRYRNATPAGVRDWASRVLTPAGGGRLVMRVLPEQPQQAASARESRPTDLPPTRFAPKAPEQFNLSNGVPVMLWRRDELPLVALTVLLQPQLKGGRQGPLDEPSKAGLDQLTSDMIQEGTKKLDSLAFGDAMQALGAQFNAAAATESMSVSLTVLKRNFDKAAALMADAIREPRFDPKDWERVQRLHLESLKQDDDQPTTVASRIAARVLFGPKNPYGWPLAGTQETASRLTLDDVKARHALIFRPDFAKVLIAGNITADEAKKTLETALGGGKWQGSSQIEFSHPDLSIPEAARLRLIIVDRPEAVQTVIRLVAPGPIYSDERRVNLRLLNTLLGGSFTSRLNQNLREAHGYTYGAGSRFVMYPSAGYFTASSSVRADVTGAALKEFLSEVTRLRTGDISDAEAGKARETLRNDVVESFAGLGGVLGAAAELETSGLPFTTLAADMARMQEAAATDLNKLARPAIPMEQAVLVLVGDKKLILEQIKGMDLPTPVEMTVKGEPVK